MHRSRRLLVVAVPVALAAAALAAPAGAGAIATLVRASGATPFPPGCEVDTPGSVNQPNAEVEPWISVDPTDDDHAIAVWQQDRWNDGGSRGLMTGVTRNGGRTWARTFAHFTTCSGGTAANGGDYERASDPWVAIGPDGTAVQIALAFDVTTSREAILTSRSTNGGRTWSEPAVVTTDDSDLGFLDKESITADPKRKGTFYATWDIVLTDPETGLSSQPAVFARSTDGGRSWEKPVVVYQPPVGDFNGIIAAQVVVLPNGDLLNLFANFIGPSAEVVVARSHDRGRTWEPPVTVGELGTIGIVDVETGEPVRTGDIIPDIAVDEHTGRVYAVWQDARFSGFERDGIALSHSDDGGRTWSPATQVNQAPDVQAFTASVDVADDGTVGVTYYNTRNDTPDPATMLTDTWLATSPDGGTHWSERRLGPSFDMRTAPDAFGFFVGDYQGLDHRDDTFVPFFSAANTGNTANRTDVFAALVGGDGDHGHGRVEHNDHPRSAGERMAERRHHR